jgi:hypothetical protein
MPLFERNWLDERRPGTPSSSRSKDRSRREWPPHAIEQQRQMIVPLFRSGAKSGDDKDERGKPF